MFVKPVVCLFMIGSLASFGWETFPSPLGAILRGCPRGFCQAPDTTRYASLISRGIDFMALSVQTILERNRLFRGLSAATIAQISALAIRRPYPEGAIVFSQGDPGDALYGVVTGRIRISASTREGKEMFLNIMEPGTPLVRSRYWMVIRGLPPPRRRSLAS